MHAMSRLTWSSRCALWAIALALVLKAAVPMLAAGAAHLRGVSVAEICSIYGVAMPQKPANDAHQHHAHHAHHASTAQPDGDGSQAAGRHGSDHCALTALIAFTVPEAHVPTIPRLDGSSTQRVSSRDAVIRDASKAWVARLQHAPPQLA